MVPVDPWLPANVPSPLSISVSPPASVITTRNAVLLPVIAAEVSEYVVESKAPTTSPVTGEEENLISNLRYHCPGRICVEGSIPSYVSTANAQFKL